MRPTELPSDLVNLDLIDPLIAHQLKVTYELNNQRYTSTQHLNKLTTEQIRSFKLEQLERSQKLLKVRSI